MFFVKWSLDTNGIYFLSDMICRKVFIIVRMSLTLHKLNSIFVQFCITSQWRLFWTFFLHVVHEFLKKLFFKGFWTAWVPFEGLFYVFLRPGIFVKYFLSFPHKNHSSEKIVYFSIFEWLASALAFWENWSYGQFYHT